MDDISIQILGNSPTNVTQKTINGGFQQFNTTIEIDNFSFEISKRIFIDLETLIDMDGYIEAENKVYKILHIKEFSDYMEVWLYELTRQPEVI
ncbi:MAG: hypothetical protein APF81_17690 [Desulfosporosinus sp. BRH_c37]|nr:MAG: hypothetical protein APF81_17690 [Desulfosporosinus sp. BRH_c37]